MDTAFPVCGIVAEYNPFHSGHRFHIERTREMLGEHTIIVCAMSGNFVQRGDFAVLDKYARAEAAVRGGADLVLELPLAAALSSAEGFARGAVALLHGIGCRYLSFGAETADLSLVRQAAEALNALPPAAGNRSGLSYAAYRQQELAALNPAAAAPVTLPEGAMLTLLRAALFRGALATGSADGFDERCAAAVYSAVSFSDAVEKAQTRRFPAARVRRTLLRAALGISPDASPLPSYARVLAFSSRGRTLLRQQVGLPLIVKPVTEKQLPDALQPSLRLDAFADDLFGLARPAPLPGGEHYRKTPFYLT